MPRNRVFRLLSWLSLATALLLGYIWLRSHASHYDPPTAFSIHRGWDASVTVFDGGLFFSFTTKRYLGFDDYYTESSPGKLLVEPLTIHFGAPSQPSTLRESSHRFLGCFYRYEERDPFIEYFAPIRLRTHEVRCPVAFGFVLLILPILNLISWIKMPKPRDGLLCPKCSYDLRAHADKPTATCPECGTAVTFAQLPKPIPFKRKCLTFINRAFIASSFALSVLAVYLEVTSFQWTREILIRRDNTYAMVAFDGQFAFVFADKDRQLYYDNSIADRWEAELGGYIFRSKFLDSNEDRTPPYRNGPAIGIYTGNHIYANWGSTVRYLRLPGWIILLLLAIVPAWTLTKHIQTRRRLAKA